MKKEVVFLNWGYSDKYGDLMYVLENGKIEKYCYKNQNIADDTHYMLLNRHEKIILTMDLFGNIEEVSR